MRFQAMTFNLRYDNLGDGPNQWSYRIDAVAAMIREHDPLVVGTQEGFYSMLIPLAEWLDDYAWTGTGRLGGQENEHCAIFYKKRELQLAETGTFWLSEQPDTPGSKSWDSNLPRICTWARFIHLETGLELAVFNTHLDHIGQRARSEGARMIKRAIKSLRERHGIAVLLTGDFNSHPGDDPIRFLRGETDAAETEPKMLTDAYTALQGDIGLSAHSFQGGAEGEPIDYIFATPELHIAEVRIDRSRIQGRYPSDHYPVIAGMEFRRGGASV
ncbi:endonuclease/exonuclease/phosphatase family protein [Paenibacillus filicis]|uniref:Endonuclease/exonuclease/phosphatase family protein n=1 Tax=Paenibacillus gyeongsangnamensis TaxID=3388067 RepID=A0ABT4QJS3_9BACL|nr:endonuclease/exonuclease/phosphatase family protein [Paenibacillus filicis]MCZ8517128.1 endonuclease/exonuclease/phosphatase family protein [Paenibacillus filicis]